MENQALSSVDQKISAFIWEKPEVVVDILKRNGIYVSGSPTLNEIVEKTFKAIYDDLNVKFTNMLDRAIAGEEYNSIIPLLVTAGISLATSVYGNEVARAKIKSDQRIALAQLQQAENIALTQIRAESETARTQIIINSLAEYQKSLQQAMTVRERDTYIYIGILAAGVVMIYGTVQLFKTS